MKVASRQNCSHGGDIIKALISLFQALCQCGHLKKRVDNEQGLVEKEGVTDPACS